MPNPVFLDGPLAGQDFPVTQAVIDDGQITVTPDSPLSAGQVIYTISRIGVFGRVIVVASVAGGIPSLALLFEHLVSDRARAAAE
jgi:hypothetical protein